MKTTRLLAALLLGSLFLFAGAIKGSSPRESVLAVGAYDILPDSLALGIGAVLPGIEVMVGVALITGFLVRGAGLATACLACVFAVAAASADLRGLDLDCGCFGRVSLFDRAGLATALFDLVLAGAGVLVATGPRKDTEKTTCTRTRSHSHFSPWRPWRPSRS